MVACFKLISSISAGSCIIWEKKTVLLSLVLSVDKNACLIMMSIMFFSMFTAVALELG